MKVINRKLWLALHLAAMAAPVVAGLFGFLTWPFLVTWVVCSFPIVFFTEPRQKPVLIPESWDDQL